MPYKESDVPSGTEKVPAHGQAIYRAAFNSAYKQYEGNEERAQATAWAAVKRRYKKKGDQWVSKDGISALDAMGSSVNVTVPALVRLMEYGREKAKSDLDLHKVAEHVAKVHEKKGSVESGDLEGVADGDTSMLTDKEFSTARRETLAKSGKAMPGGGFPIESEQDLKNAIHAIGRAKNPAAAKAHIKTRARALGLSKLIPENWDSVEDGMICDVCMGTGLNDDQQACPDCNGTGYTADSIEMTDSFLIDGVRRTRDGYLVADARVARTGVQLYKGREVGRPDLETVRVYRPPNEVFNNDAMHSFAHRPITLKHPPTTVDANNWKKYAVGQTGDEVVRDGDCVRVPMVVMDQAAIDAYEKDGIKELSMGYSTDLKWRPGVTDGGEEYDAIQTAIRANHLAIVPVARGGSHLRIGDDSKKGDRRMPVQILLDGTPVEVADEVAARHIQTHVTKLHGMAADLQGRLDKSEADKEQEAEKRIRAEKDAADAKTALDAANGKVAVLEKQLSDEKAKTTPEFLDAAVKTRTDIVSKALSIVKDGQFDGKSIEDIRRTVVASRLGDAAKDMSDAAIEGAFSVMVTDQKPIDGTRLLADALSRGGQQGPNNATQLRDAALMERDRKLTEAWRPVN